MDKIVIDIGFANMVVEQIDNCAVYPEVSVMLQDKETGALIQDVAMVRPAVNEATGAMIPDAVDCFVWANANDDGFTDKFVIQKYKGDGPCGSYSWLSDGRTAGINMIHGSGKPFASSAEAAIQIAASGRCCAICSVKCADKGEVTACTAFRWNGSAEADNGAHEGEHNG